MKTCTKCNETKPLEEFRKRVRNKDGRDSLCSRCHNEYLKEYRNARPPREDPVYRRHGMTKEQFDAMYEDQRGLCANPSCNNPATVIDHDHSCCAKKRSCGKCIMGLLCSPCNTAEGLLAGSVEKTIGLAEYINKTRRSNEGH